jgi:hypothetical protein
MPTGPTRAFTRSVSDHLSGIIVNAATIDRLSDNEFPDKYQLELYRLRRRVADLEAVITDKNDRIGHCLAMLEDEILFWRTYMQHGIGETLGQLDRRIGRLESTLAFIRDIQPHVVPPLEIKRTR